MSWKSQTFDRQHQSTYRAESADGFATTLGEGLAAERILVHGSFDPKTAPLRMHGNLLRKARSAVHLPYTTSYVRDGIDAAIAATNNASALAFT